LTGLGNHRSFQEELDRQMETYRRHKVPFALLLIDLDDLKVVNDGEGHPAGDRLLVGMANSIRDALRYGDRPFRIGGDEFAVIMPHTDAGDAHVAANRLRHFCLRPPAGERVIPFSGGISSIPMLAADRTDLFRQADAALYRCKRNGRGTVEVYDADRDQLPEETTVQGGVTAIRDVIRARKLMPVFQPIVDLRDGKVLGFEGLVRPTPGSALRTPASSSARPLRPVDQELDLACFEVVAAGSVDIDVNQVVTINLSPQTLEVEDFSAAWLLEILARHRLSTGRVIVELTEREAINDLERLRRNIAALQHAGVRLAADDVGAGNAGLLPASIDIAPTVLGQDGAHHDSSRTSSACLDSPAVRCRPSPRASRRRSASLCAAASPSARATCRRPAATWVQSRRHRGARVRAPSSGRAGAGAVARSAPSDPGGSRPRTVHCCQTQHRPELLHHLGAAFARWRWAAWLTCCCADHRCDGRLRFSGILRASSASAGWPLSTAGAIRAGHRGARS
jgi:diguanylate cyclase (GGDEF)-like protein